MIQQTGSVAIVVSNAKKSAKWYSEKLGFKANTKMGHWVTVASRKDKIVLHLCEQKKLEPGNTGISFDTDDIDRTYEQLTKKGVKFTKAPHDDGWGKYAMFKDPDGNVFWLS